MPFTITLNAPIVTASVKGSADEPPISIEVDLRNEQLPPEVAHALRSQNPHLLPLSWKRAFFAVLGSFRGMEGVVAVDTNNNL